MIRQIISYIINVLLIIGLQGIVLNNLDLGMGILPMLYPLIIIVLPLGTSTYLAMFIAFGLGAIIDAYSNTYGLHISALLLVAYLRPFLLKLVSPRDGYEGINVPHIFVMGKAWTLYFSFVILFIHHLWFFSLEYFSFSDTWTIIQNTFLSAFLSLIIAMIYQILFFRKRLVIE